MRPYSLTTPTCYTVLQALILSTVLVAAATREDAPKAPPGPSKALPTTGTPTPPACPTLGAEPVTVTISLPPPLVAPADPDGAERAARGPIHPHELLLAHNRVRKAAGLPDLIARGELMYAAQEQADFMARTTTMVHTRPSGYSLTSRLMDYKVGWIWAGENIASGYPTTEALMKAWNESPGHRANIISKDAVQVGFGISGTSYCVVFIKPR